MKRFIPLVVLGAGLFAIAVHSDESPLDKVSQQAAQLEAQLSKMRSTTPEAGDVMVKLVDLYHQHGRVYGLVKVGQDFVAQHSAHPKHKEVMLKLLDGLRVAGRFKESIATARQFLVRYPKEKECPAVEEVLSRLLDRSAERLAAAEIHEAIWRRQGPNPEGRRAGAQAVLLYAAANNKEGFARAAQLAEALVDKVPPGPFVTEVGYQALDNWERAAEWAKANLAALQLLKKNLPADPTQLRELHRRMGENYARIGQRANAIDSFKKAMALGERPELHQRLILEMHAALAKPEEMEPVVNAYVQKYPERAERFAMRSYLAHALLRGGDKPRALAILAELLPHDARTNDNAAVYVRTNGTLPAQLAQSEQVLRTALAANKRDAAYLRYVLGFELYRDRLKDLAKARTVIRELVTQTPSNDGLTQAGINWLLANPVNEDEFKADVAKLLEVRRARIEWSAHRGYLPGWAAEAAKNKESKARAAWARAELARSDADPLFKEWLATESANKKAAMTARAALLAPEREKNLSDDQAWLLLTQQAADYRLDVVAKQRANSVPVYSQMTRRFPKNYPAALGYLETATDYGPPEVAREAARHLLTLTPEYHSADAGRRLLLAADNAKDAALVKQAFTWFDKAQQKFGFDSTYGSYIGDMLDKHGLKQEAVDYWRRAVVANRDAYESRACAERLLRGPMNRGLTPPARQDERAAFLQDLLKTPSNYHGLYAAWLADDFLKENKLDDFEKTLRAALEGQQDRPYRGWGLEETLPQAWLERWRTNKDASAADKQRVFAMVRDLRLGRTSAAAALALLELPGTGDPNAMPRLLAFHDAIVRAGSSASDWDWLMPYVQAAMSRKDYVAASTLATGMLAHMPAIDAARKKTGLDMVRQSYARMGGLGLSIDENSPIAPLLQAALYLRLGDDRLAFDTYATHRALFDKHRGEMPVDLVLFVCESHLAAGGDANFNRVEDILRGWLVKNSEVKEVEDAVKARVQLLLARNYFRSQRYDVARSEFTTVINRYGKTPQAVEAEFGIGESFMAQKVYDQAQAVFEKLAHSQDRDIVIRAEFLRGVLASRRGDRDEARLIFRSVLERVPSIELANQALYNLSEVYGAEQRYIDQLELLRTVGRLGRASKRWHTPGTVLSIVVQDSDLGISRGHAKIPVKVTTLPGGDEELIFLRSGGAGKGLFRADLETRLGKVSKNDKILQLTGRDVIQCDYPDEFKKEFRNVPLPDAEIRIAANARLEVGSSKIIDKDEESFSQRLQREARAQEEGERRLSQNRPLNQIKPGNVVYLRVHDADRDLSDEPDKITVKLVSSSGDQVQAVLLETGPHTGVFEGTVTTGELPAGALASDSAIDHGPLLAIDKDERTFWLSQPDGATPKWLSIDMKDLRTVDRVRVTSPDPAQRAPVRGILEGSNDGRFWFRLASNPPPLAAASVASDSERMTLRLYQGAYTNFSKWDQVVDLSKNGKPLKQEEADQLSWTLPEGTAKDPKEANKQYGALWHGKLVQPRAGAARIVPRGTLTAVALDGRLALELGAGARSVDVWLEQGIHDLTIFCAGTGSGAGLGATWTRADHNAAQVTYGPFKSSDFNVQQPGLKPAVLRPMPELIDNRGTWEFRFAPIALRHVRLVVQEYRGEAVAISNVEIASADDKKSYIPTQADVLSLATNDILEIAAGDIVTASYVDEFTETVAGTSRLLMEQLTATYFNAVVSPIAHDLVRQGTGPVTTIRKQLMRIDPGERLIVEIVDYDQDHSATPDKARFQVAVNDGPPVDFVAQETGDDTGIFTKEVDTSAKPEKGKLTVKPGDRVYCRYLDVQNTFPGHAVLREAVVYVNEPTEGRLRIVETRYLRPPPGKTTAPKTVYLPARDDVSSSPEAAKKVANVAFEVPLTLEVYDKDAAKDSRSTVTVQLTTSDGAKLEVECVVSSALLKTTTAGDQAWALDEGRFVGQVILQLGSKHSPDVVPLTAGMPRTLIGGPKMGKEDGGADRALITRVLNVTGKDVIDAVYLDQRRPKGPEKLTSRGRLIANGTLACTDAEYKKPITQLHVGERLYLMIVDPDLDQSDERDKAKVEITSKRGEKETVELLETLNHSGIFTGSVALKATETAKPGNLSAENPIVECYFGDILNVRYLDETAGTENGKLVVELEVPVVIGTDGLVAAFSKTFHDEKLAVETQFHIAESYFELFKSHKSLQRTDEERADLEAGRRVLREVMRDYPSPKYLPRIAYLMGQFAQELQQWNEAIDSYQLIVRQYPEHALAADAQFKLAQCYEEAGEFDQALEAYVTLAATYPKSPLIANVMLRIIEHFYKKEDFQVAAQVGEKFLERFEGHKWGPKIAFRVGQCYYKDKLYPKAGASFDRFAKTFPDDPLTSDGLFWAGESFRMAKNDFEAFKRYNKCRWDFPSSEAAKYARGRLALPEMLRQFENAANLEK